MDPVAKILSNIRRPRLLIRAARFGLQDYNRARDLKRLIGSDRSLSPGAALDRLLAEERRIEETRQSGDARYNAARHVEVLVAMLAEAQLSSRRLPADHAVERY